MKRPPSIPPDVWENLTCNDAAEAGLLGSVSKEWLIVGGKALLRDADDSALIARMLEENISHVAIGHACRIVRARKTGDWLDNHIKKNVLKDVKLMARPARIPEDVWDALTVHEAVEADLLGEAALEMAKPETLCRELESGSVLAKCLRQNVDVNRSHGRPSADEILARTALRFDLAVRTGEPLAVSAYGLILFALSGRAEREREQARAVMSAADNAMDAVMRAAREVSEGA